LASGLHLPASAAELTLEWMLDPENLRPLETCRAMWLPDETLLLDDPRLPEAARGLERLDPRTLERRPACDGPRVLASWEAVLGKGNRPRRVSLPSAIAADGKTFLYEREGDLYAVGFDAGVRRLTNTEATEESPRFSPDGRSLAYVRENDLYLVEVQSGRERRLTRDGGPTRINGALSWVYWEELMDRNDEGFSWSPDSASIFFLQSDESPVTTYPLVDIEPAVPNVRQQRYPKAGGVNPVVRAGILDVASAGVRWIDLGSPAPEYLARADWLPDSSRIALQTLNRAQNRLELWIVERSSGERRRVLEETSATWINLHRDLHFLPDCERFLWLSERDGRRHLYLHRLGGGPGTAITSGDWVLRAGGGSSEGCVAWIDGAAGRVYFHAARPSPFETQLHRAALDGGGLERVTEGEGAHSVTVSPRGSFFLDRSSRAGVPPRLSLHRIDGALLQVLSPSAAGQLEPFSLVPPKLYTVPADDGTPLPVRLFAPSPVLPGRRHPAIVYVYGGPTAPMVSDRWEGPSYLWAQLLARRGFAVFTVDPRSASDRGKALEDSVHRHFYGEGELKDILAGVRHLKSLDFVDPDRVGIWGWSGGGTNTLYAMTHSEEFRAGIAVAGVADQRYYDTIYTERYMGLPTENAAGYRAIAPANAAEKLHGRLLLVHGTADDNVHPQSAMRMAGALIAAGKQFDLMLYPGRNHGIGDPFARRHLYRMMLDFWEKWLEPPRRSRL
jgi:dipeptidyl-peptidase-4